MKRRMTCPNASFISFLLALLMIYPGRNPIWHPSVLSMILITFMASKTYPPLTSSMTRWNPTISSNLRAAPQQSCASQDLPFVFNISPTIYPFLSGETMYLIVKKYVFS
jgi:hypothetical protein